jgi:hypothetical protein
MNHPLYKHQGNIYQVIRKVRHHMFRNKDHVKEFKDLLPFCDHVLKDQTHYLFCETVQEAEIC